MSGHIKLIDFRNNSTKLRERALQGKACGFSQTVTRDDETVGIVVPMEDTASFLASKPASSLSLNIRSFTAKQFYQTVNNALANGESSPLGDINIVSFRQNRTGTGTALSVISEDFWTNHMQAFESTHLLNTHISVPANVRKHTNVDIALDFTSPWKTLQSEIGTIAATTAEGAAVYRRDGEIAGLSSDTALKLKEHIFNGRSDIIQDWRALDFKHKLGEACQSVIERRHFIRISGAERPGSHNIKQLCTLVDGLSAEFLVLEHGKVSEIDGRTNIPYRFDFDATICTDFENASKIKIKFNSPSQLSFVRKAFQQARMRNDDIMFQNIGLRFTKDTVEMPDLRKSSNFAFDTCGYVDFCLSRTGKLNHLRFTFNSQPGLSAMASLGPRYIEFQTSNVVSQHSHFLLEKI